MVSQLRLIAVALVLVCLLSFTVVWHVHQDTLIPTASSSSSLSPSLSTTPKRQQQHQRKTPLLSDSSWPTISDVISNLRSHRDDAGKAVDILFAPSTCSAADVFRDVAALVYFVAHAKEEDTESDDEKVWPLASCRVVVPEAVCRSSPSSSLSRQHLVASMWVREGLVAGGVCSSVSETLETSVSSSSVAASAAVRLCPSLQLVVDTRDAAEHLRALLWPAAVRDVIAKKIAPVYAVKSSGPAPAHRKVLETSNVVIVPLDCRSSSSKPDAAKRVRDALRDRFFPLVAASVLRLHVDDGDEQHCLRQRDLKSRIDDAVLAELISAHVVVFVGESRSWKLRLLPMLLPGTLVVDFYSSGSSSDIELEALASWLSVDYVTPRLFALAVGSASASTANQQQQEQQQQHLFHEYHRRVKSSVSTDGDGGTGAFHDASSAPQSILNSQRFLASIKTVTSSRRASGGVWGNARNTDHDNAADGEENGSHDALISMPWLQTAMREVLVTSYMRRYRFSNVRLFDLRRN